MQAEQMGSLTQFLNKGKNVITTKKIDSDIKNLSDEDKKKLDGDVYLSKGVYCYYTADQKGVSIEYVIDKLIDKKALFLLEIEDVVYIVFSHCLKDTITFKHQNNEHKLLSVLKLAMMQSQCQILYTLEHSKILENLTMPHEVIKQKAFSQALKSTPKLQTLSTQLTKAAVFALVILFLCVAQSFFFDYLREISTNEYRSSKDKISLSITNTQNEHNKFAKMISDLPTGIANNYKEIIDELSGVQK